VGGSIVRDIIMNEIPYFFTNEFYGTVAILMVLGVVLLKHRFDDRLNYNLHLYIRIHSQSNRHKI